MDRPFTDLRVVVAVIIVATHLLSAAAALAATCTVPGSHASLLEAVGDETCTVIELAAQTYSEGVQIGRSLDLTGSPAGDTVVEGFVKVFGASTQVTVSDIDIESGCPGRIGLQSSGGAEVSSVRVGVVRSTGTACPTLIFGDGFESGDTSTWTSSTP